MRKNKNNKPVVFKQLNYGRRHVCFPCLTQISRERDAVSFAKSDWSITSHGSESSVTLQLQRLKIALDNECVYEKMKKTLFDYGVTKNNIEKGTDSNTSESHDPDEKTTEVTDDGPEAKKRKLEKVFQRSWAEKWPWLEKNDKEGMFCKLCVKHKKNNAFTSPQGCINFRTSTLKRHAATSDHMESLKDDVMQNDFSRVRLF